MIQKLKRWLFFPAATYFRFWAAIRLKRWHPRIILITGSSGKTTLLHLLETQIGARAHYSHHANSAFGIPFDILGFPARTNRTSEWLRLILFAPFQAFKQPFDQPFYVVEADSDRPGEARFLTRLLQPEITIWLSSDKSHSGNFDSQVQGGQFNAVEEAIAQEFGHFLVATSRLVIVNGDSQLIASQLKRTSATIEKIIAHQISGYRLGADSTTFTIHKQSIQLPVLLPEAAGRSVAAVLAVCKYLDMPVNPSFEGLSLPPGRSSVFKGIKNTTIIDSTYNAIPDAVRAILGLFEHYPGSHKWVVVGDMVEQGQSEASEHGRLAEDIAKLNLDHIILMGPRVARYTAPKLKALIGQTTPLQVFTEPKPALDYLSTHLQGGEVVLFKGARFLEGVIEHLLADPADAARLCRREPVWQQRRRRWGL